MCGRFALTSYDEHVKKALDLSTLIAPPPRYNIAPTQAILIITAGATGREARLVRWGLVPSWVKDITAFPLLFNARGESVVSKPAFRGAMRHRRCLIPADGFYEWQKREGRSKQPYLLRRPDRRMFYFAGLWESWMDAQGNELDSAAIVTVAANKALAPIHDRMPAVIMQACEDQWLDPQVPAVEAAQLLQPAPDDFFEVVPVSDRVSRFANDDARVQEAAQPAEAKKSAAPPKPDQPDLL
jgi:putative SOS response-associated peptidase YedK